jgi:hypothetical protein
MTDSQCHHLQEFCEHARVTLASGEVVNAALEERSGREPRPVLRLPSSDGFGAGASAPGMAEAAAEAATRPEGWGGERIFTRVHPEHRGTSMLIHVQVRPKRCLSHDLFHRSSCVSRARTRVQSNNKGV